MQKDIIDGQKLSYQIKFYSDYSKFKYETNRYESWNESVERVKKMNYDKLGDRIRENEEFEKMIYEAFESYKKKNVLASQRSLQFGGDPILKHNSKMFNCLSSYADRVEFFQDTMYWLLSGCGLGFSVLPKFTDKLPKLAPRTKGVKTFTPKDNIEGWSDTIGVLISSFVEENPDAPYYQQPTFPEYQGYRVEFDLSKIRPKGSFISGGFKAPGAEPLRQSLLEIQKLIESEIEKNKDQPIIFRPILIYDTIMHSADAVIAGGVRRSATICLFDKNDKEMMTAKTYPNFDPSAGKNKQRGRSNNSVLLVRDETSQEEFNEMFSMTKDWGEPGFVWAESEDVVFNPCVEIGMFPAYKIKDEETLNYLKQEISSELQLNDWISGFQGCNLVEINGSHCNTPDDFYEYCKHASLIGTLQASYTDFKYVSPASKLIFDKEALLGVSVTGWMNNPDVLFDENVQRTGAEIVKETNKKVANWLDINQSARTTCVKPSGNASVILETASGIHGEHAPRYFRNMQINKTSDIAKEVKSKFPKLIQESVWSRDKNDYVISCPVVAKENSIFKNELMGIKQLEKVKLTQNNWVEYGTNEELCTKPWLRHNVSNTIQVDDWDEIRDYIYDNRHHFAGISLLSMFGDLDYDQAPFVEVLTGEKIIKKYGDGAVFASGLIVDILDTFENNLWNACSTVLGHGEKLSYTEDEALEILDDEYEKDPIQTWVNLGLEYDIAEKLVRAEEVPSHIKYREYLEEKLLSDVFNGFKKKNILRRMKKFSKKYFDGDLIKTTYCLKDVYNFHRWKDFEDYKLDSINWETLDSPTFMDIDTTASVACNGDHCEVV